MTITPYQIVVPLLSLVAIAYAWSLTMRHKKTMWESLLWSLFWLGIAAIAIWPDLLDVISQLTGIKKRENAVLVTAIGILFFIVFYLIIRLEELEQRQTDMIRKIALHNTVSDQSSDDADQ